jgi:hypothetical protein
MVVNFKYDRGDVVYYLWESVVGGECAAIGQGTIEMLHYNSGRLNCPSYGEEGQPVYNIKRNRLGCINIPEEHVFKKWIEARKYATAKGIPTISRVLRETDKE